MITGRQGPTALAAEWDEFSASAQIWVWALLVA
jgi:hypothetical protein